MSLPGRNISMGKVTIAASGASPRPATALVMTPTKSARVSVTVGIPCASSLAAARPHAVAQDPQAAFPMMTASTPLCLTAAAVSSEPITALPCGNASSGSTSIPGKSASSSDFNSGSMRKACHWSLLTKPSRWPASPATRGAKGCLTSIAPDGSWNASVFMAGLYGGIQSRTLTCAAAGRYDGPVADYVTRTRRFTRAEYDRLIELGVFQADEDIELIGGELIVGEPQGAPHYTAIRKTAKALEAAFGPGWEVRTEGPIGLDDESEPEPDVAVVPGSVDDYARVHPSRATLTVEVAESSLALDRRHKGSLYARSGLTDYWILNLVDRVLEVYRTPVADDAAPFGWRYAEREVLDAFARVTPLAAPQSSVSVSQLLP